jgi:hypothetical protein
VVPAAAGLAVVGESGEAMARPCGDAVRPWELYDHRAPQRHAGQSGRGSGGLAQPCGDAAGLGAGYYRRTASAREASSMPMSSTSVRAAQASIPTSREPLRAARARAPRCPDAAQPAAVETHNAPDHAPLNAVGVRFQVIDHDNAPRLPGAQTTARGQRRSRQNLDQVTLLERRVSAHDERHQRQRRHQGGGDAASD